MYQEDTIQCRLPPPPDNFALGIVSSNHNSDLLETRWYPKYTSSSDDLDASRRVTLFQLD
jgi:hypothetical protein